MKLLVFLITTSEITNMKYSFEPSTPVMTRSDVFGWISTLNDPLIDFSIIYPSKLGTTVRIIASGKNEIMLIMKYGHLIRQEPDD